MKETYKAGWRIWIEGESATFLGEGRVRLLEQIEASGSINEASRKMGMSYKKALKLLDSMNSQSESPLVISNSGGKGGGGSVVTEEGKRAIRRFRELSEKCDAFINEELKNFHLHE